MNLLEDKIGFGGGSGGGWYHCSVKTVSRGAGRSAVAAASYRLGMELHDELTGITHDYTRRSGVVSTFILAPDDAPEWAFDAEAFWNAAEASETRRNSRVAREVELALPDALTPEERKEVAARTAQYLVDRYQVGVTVAIHAPGRHGDDRNHHAHLLFSTRRVGPDGFGAKTRELDDKVQGSLEVVALRKHCAFIINDVLERAGQEERVDYRSFKARGIAREGTKHLGPSAHQIEKRGKDSRRGDRNREIVEGNNQVDQIVVDLAALEAELRDVQEALLDERYGLPDEPASGSATLENPDATAPADDPPIAEESPPWWPDVRQPDEALAPGQADAFMEQAAEPYLAQIEQHGELQDDGTEPWHLRIARRGVELFQQAASWTRGKWQSLVANRRGREEHPREGPER